MNFYKSRMLQELPEMLICIISHGTYLSNCVLKNIPHNVDSHLNELFVRDPFYTKIGKLQIQLNKGY